jgi:hypothetical protein
VHTEDMQDQARNGQIAVDRIPMQRYLLKGPSRPYAIQGHCPPVHPLWLAYKESMRVRIGTKNVRRRPDMSGNARFAPKADIREHNDMATGLLTPPSGWRVQCD